MVDLPPDWEPMPYGTPRKLQTPCQEAVFVGATRRGCLVRDLGHVVHRNGSIAWWGRIGNTQIWVPEPEDEYGSG